MGGRELPHRMPHQEVRHQTPRLHQPEQRHLHSEQPRLGEHRPVQGLGVLTEHHLPHRTVQMTVQFRTHLVERRREHRERGIQLPPHAQPLSALTGEQESRAAAARHRARDHARGELVKTVQQLLTVAADDRRPVAEGGPGQRQRVAHVHRVQLRLRRHIRPQPPRLGPQRRLAAGREHPRHRAEGRRPFLGGVVSGGVGGCFLQHHVHIGAAHAERADTREPWGVRVRLRDPGIKGGLDREAQGVQGDRWVRCLVVEAREQLAVGEREHRLDETGDSGRAFEVAHVGLGGADPQGRAVRPAGAEDRAQRRGLDRVADSGAGAVQFDVLDPGGVDPGALVGGAQHGLLPVGRGGGEAVAAAVVVGVGTADHAQHRVAVAQRVREPLEHHEAAALAAHIAVGAGVEGEGAAVGGERAEPGGGDEAVGGEVELDAARDGGLGLAAPQALAGQVHGGQGGGLPGVHGHARAAQPEGVGDPVGDDAAVQAGEGVLGDGGRFAAVYQGRVVVGDGADEDAGAAALESRRDEAGVFQGLPAQFQREPLLGVHRPCLSG
ncbi:hypothetical protein GCM10022420_030950 [Streptomyces iranensis]